MTTAADVLSEATITDLLARYLRANGPADEAELVRYIGWARRQALSAGIFAGLLNGSVLARWDEERADVVLSAGKLEPAA